MSKLASTQLAVVGSIFLTLFFVAPNIMQSLKAGKEVMAQTTLRQISNSLESYMALHQVYPSDPQELLKANPPYLTKNYFEGEHAGYTFKSQLSDYSYTVTAYPAGGDGKRSYSIETGGVFKK